MQFIPATCTVGLFMATYLFAIAPSKAGSLHHSPNTLAAVRRVHVGSVRKQMSCGNARGVKHFLCDLRFTKHFVKK